MKAWFAVPVAAVLLAGCAGGGGSASAGGSPQPLRRDANIISEEEIRASASQTVHGLVQSLRPAWLMRRRPTAILQSEEGALLVYVDGSRFGDAESLKQMFPNGVLSIRYFPPTEAQGRFGPGHLQGAIEVVTSRGR